MYGLVMMAALTAGADATPAPVVMAAPVVSGCCGTTVLTGCGGCGGYSFGGYSHGGCWGGCYGGCYGGGWGHGRKWFGHKHGCVSYGGCGFSYGPSYGCCGWSTSFSYGCCGGGYGSWNYGCGYIPSYGAYNIGGGGMIYSTPGTVVAPATVVPAAPAVVPPPIAAPETKKDAANIQFVLPADAKLYVDGNLTNGTGEERPFYTPSLDAGRKFYYDVKAEMVVNGETVVEEKRVIVQAGDNLRESFPRLIAAAAQKAPNLTVATK